LAHPDEIPDRRVDQEELIRQLQAASLTVQAEDPGPGAGLIAL